MMAASSLPTIVKEKKKILHKSGTKMSDGTKAVLTSFTYWTLKAYAENIPRLLRLCSLGGRHTLQFFEKWTCDPVRSVRTQSLSSLV